MWDFLKKRFSEPSTFVGLGMATLGIGQVAKISEAPAIADAITGTGQAIAAGMDPITAAVVGLAGLVAAFMKDPGSK